MEQNTFLQEYFKTIQYLHQLKKYIKRFSGTTKTDSWKANECQKKLLQTKLNHVWNVVTTMKLFIKIYLGLQTHLQLITKK